MSEENRAEGKKQRKILFIDIPGVLNGTRMNPYGHMEFDADKMARLVRIVKETQCEMCITPQYPNDKNQKGYATRVVTACVNMFRAIFPEVSISAFDCPEVAVTQFADPDNKVYSYAVVRCFDRPDFAWECTFPVRMVKTKHEGGNGLTDEDAKRIMAMLATEVEADDIPLKVVRMDDVIATAQSMIKGRTGSDMMERPVCGCGDWAQEKMFEVERKLDEAVKTTEMVFKLDNREMTDKQREQTRLRFKFYIQEGIYGKKMEELLKEAR